MNTKKLPALVLTILIAGVLSAPALALPQKKKPRKITTAPSEKPLRDEFTELLLRTQKAAEQAQVEARRAREKNEELQKQLAQNTEELVQLRQAITNLGGQLAEIKLPKTHEVSSANSPAPSPSEPPPAEKLQAEVETLKEQVEINTAQIKEHAQTKVESDSRFRIKLTGMILANTFLNTKDSSLNDVPLVAPPPGIPINKNNVGASLRQSRLGFQLAGPRLSQKLGSARISAETEFDFWGGSGSAVLGSFRILTASVRLEWEKTSLIVGQRGPMISPRNPTSLAALWFAPFTGAGNLWQWRPQIIAEHRVKIGDSSELQLQGGMMMPFGENVQNAVIEGGPGYESRLAFSHALDTDRNLEIGFGGYFHRRPFSFGRNVNSYALTTDWAIPLGSRFELSGEAYLGRANNLGEPSGSQNDRLYAVTGLLSNPVTQIRGVYATGGWSQLSFKARQNLDFNFAYGQEDPRNRDIFSGPTTSFTPGCAACVRRWR